ncbi:hypothetical protein DPMN_141656 [Dreissena polymorpha]|uniref:Uncharacterized protein n=1 Tax=Dreissena polymorpha TaxID=45954 RepID=A0A9D4G9W8_DREPO|nr:hypothetical protein DPMN_141656 [Dreissena polymorpha]
MARQRPTRIPTPHLVMGSCIAEIDQNRCRNKEVMVKGNFGWAGAPQVEIDLNRCRNEDVIVKGNFGQIFHVIQLTGTIFELNSHIKETNVLTKFHENWAKNVTSRVFTCFYYKHIEKNAPLTGGHVFSPIWTIFELTFMMIGKKIVTSRVKTAPSSGGHVFQRTGTTFELIQHINKTNILTKDLVFDPARPNFELDRDLIGTKLLTKFHEDRTINVASRVLKNKCGRTDGWTDKRQTKTGHKSSPEQSVELKFV